MKKLIFMVATVLCVAMLGACSKTEDVREKLREDFIPGCVAGGFNEKICACAFDKGTANFSEQEINQIADGSASSELLARLASATMNNVAECAGVTPEQMARAQANVTASDIKKSFRASFVQNCVQSSGGATAACNCVYEKTVADYTDDDFIELNQGSEQALNRFTNIVKAHVAECREL